MSICPITDSPTSPRVEPGREIKRRALITVIAIAAILFAASYVFGAAWYFPVIFFAVAVLAFFLIPPKVESLRQRVLG